MKSDAEVFTAFIIDEFGMTECAAGVTTTAEALRFYKEQGIPYEAIKEDERGWVAQRLFSYEQA
jgi:hypothetical protein